MPDQLLRRAANWLGTTTFRYLVLACFALQSLWIALTAAYPQAFDENFHYGIIKIYARHWLPFLSTQPYDADPYGAVTRDPSFLYHYLLSFPYRLISIFIHGQTGQVISLRLINIGLFVAGLWLFYKVLRRLGLTSTTANCCLFIMSLIPVAPQLAGQINYDNLLLPMTALACLTTFKVIDQLRDGHLKAMSILLLASTCLLASIVKYQFLPVFLAIIIFMSIYGFQKLRGRTKLAVKAMAAGWKRHTAFARLGIGVLFIIALGLFVQRDIGNIFLYHNVAPDCSKVLDYKSCSAYPVWIHDYTSHQAVLNHTAVVNYNPVAYVGEWIYWLWYRLFFAISGPGNDFQNFPPLPLPIAAFGLAVIASIISIGLSFKKLFAGKPYLAVSAVIVGVYLLTLLGAGYLKYKSTGVLELQNGRYLLPIMLLGAALGVRALQLVTAKRPQLRVGFAIVILVMMLDGGGVFTFVSRSNTAWYFQNTSAQHANAVAKTALEPILFDGPRYFSTPKWFFN